MVAWSLFSGTLPNGLNLDLTSGSITGVPNALEGDYAFIVTGENSLGDFFNFEMVIAINSPPELFTDENTTMCTSYFGLEGGCFLSLGDSESFNYSFSNSGGAIVSWSISGTLPDGVSFDTTTGTLTIVGGTVTVESFTFTISAHNAMSSSDFMMTVEISLAA